MTDESHLFFRVRHIPGADIEWASAGLRSIAEDDWDNASTLVVHNKDGVWLIHGGVDDTRPTDFLMPLLDAAHAILEYDAFVLKLVGSIYYDGGLRPQAAVYTVTEDGIKIAHAVSNEEQNGIVDSWTDFTVDDITPENRVEQQVIEILNNARMKIRTGR